MDIETSTLAEAIGQRVKHLRLSQSKTLDQLASAAGVSRRALVNVEQGAANPNVGTLLRLSEALGIGLPYLVAPPKDVRLTVLRSGEGVTLWRGEHGGTGTLVAHSGDAEAFELWEWTLLPGEAHASDAHADGTRELIQVRRGRLALKVEGNRVTLGPGDSASYPGDVAHSYRHDGGPNGCEPVTFALAVYEPERDRGGQDG